MRFGFSQFIASGFDMVMGQVTLRCDLIWIWLGTGGVRAGYIIGQVRLLVPVSIGELGGGSVNSGLAMGWSGTGPGFFGSVRLVYQCQWGLTMLCCGTFFLRWMGAGGLRSGYVLGRIW